MRKIKLAILTILLVLTSSSTVGAAQRQLTDQQLGILVSLAVDSRWVRQEAATQAPGYGGRRRRKPPASPWSTESSTLLTRCRRALLTMIAISWPVMAVPRQSCITG